MTFEPDENPADVLTDALAADPMILTPDEINVMYARLEASILGTFKPAPVLYLLPGGKQDD
jgi:hypothetical protein